MRWVAWREGEGGVGNPRESFIANANSPYIVKWSGKVGFWPLVTLISCIRGSCELCRPTCYGPDFRIILDKPPASKHCSQPASHTNARGTHARARGAYQMLHGLAPRSNYGFSGPPAEYHALHVRGHFANLRRRTTTWAHHNTSLGPPKFHSYACLCITRPKAQNLARKKFVPVFVLA